MQRRPRDGLKTAERLGDRTLNKRQANSRGPTQRGFTLVKINPFALCVDNLRQTLGVPKQKSKRDKLHAIGGGYVFARRHKWRKLRQKFTRMRGPHTVRQILADFPGRQQSLRRVGAIKC